MYRPPDVNVHSALEVLEDTFVDIHTLGLKDILVFGDLNLNLLNKADNQVNQYNNLLHSYGLKQCITEPTRIAEHSMTLIDHFWHNRDDLYSMSGVLDAGISDHELIYCTRKKVKSKEVSFVWTRTYRRFNEVEFLCDVHRTNWQPVYD